MEPPRDMTSAPPPPDEPAPGAPAPPGSGPAAVTEQLPPPGSEPPGSEPSGPPPHGGAGPRMLRRDTRHRMLGGVAAGIAEYVGIDPVIVRIVFVLLALFGGSGVLLYLAGWLLIPSNHSDQSVASEWARRPPPRRSLIVFAVGAVLALVALSDLFSSGPWWPRWHAGGGFGFFLAIVALVLIVVLLTGGTHHGGSSRLHWLIITLLVAVAALVTVSVATVFSVEAVSGVPLSGGIGASQWHPAAPAQVKPRYRLAMGNLVVDLSAVNFKPGTTDVTATVGIGRVLVELPAGPSVSVTARSGLGNVQVFGQNDGGFDSAQTMQSAGFDGAPGNSAHIVVDAEAGVGAVDVVRVT